MLSVVMAGAAVGLVFGTLHCVLQHHVARHANPLLMLACMAIGSLATPPLLYIACRGVLDAMDLRVTSDLAWAFGLGLFVSLVLTVVLGQPRRVQLRGMAPEGEA